ncbi:hypothetical protein QN405_27080, partial [Pseudomonas sp. AH2 (2023)]|nr:hypothetical protein [Pseudomonas sp. AH2 (2023)]
MAQMVKETKRYPDDLTDKEWYRLRELFPDLLRQIDTPPAHRTMGCGDRPRLDNRPQPPRALRVASGDGSWRH